MLLSFEVVQLEFSNCDGRSDCAESSEMKSERPRKQRTPLLFIVVFVTAFILLTQIPTHAQTTVAYTTLASSGTYADNDFFIISGGTTGNGYLSGANSFVPLINGNLSSIELALAS